MVQREPTDYSRFHASNGHASQLVGLTTMLPKPPAQRRALAFATVN